MSDKAVGYVRVSTREQARGGVSLDVQEERVCAYCESQGLEVVGVVKDNGVSGGKELGKRDGGKELLRLLGGEGVGHVVCLKLDRLFRDAADALRQTSEWDKAGIALHFVDFGGQAVNTKTSMGRMFLTMTAAFAELERNFIRERTTAALQYKKAHGKVYGPIPFGYKQVGEDLVKVAREQEVIERMKRERGEGRSLQAIADGLNSGEVCTKRGCRWYASTVRYILGSH